MIITKKHLPRRMVLRGAGATIALPLLDAMVPALSASRLTAANPSKRFAAVYVGMGMTMSAWTPPATEELQLTPTLHPLAAFKDRIVVASGLACRQADGNDGGPHPRCQATWGTGTRAKRTEGVDVRAGVSMDQVAAKLLASETQLASLELSLESAEMLGTCALGFSCAYSNTIAWRDATTPLPMENNPRAVFERLFGVTNTTESKVRLNGLAADRSLLDSIVGKVPQFKKRLGPSDQRKLDGFLDAVRDAERRIQKAQQQIERELPVVEQPGGVPETFADYSKLMFDLLTLAYQCDMTRVSTFLLMREGSLRTSAEVGVPEPYHPLSHHQNDPEKLAKLAKVNTYHTSLFGYFLEKLRSTNDGDGSLLDHTLLLYGSGMSNSNAHWPFDVPTLVVGGSLFDVKGGRHVLYEEGTSLASLQLSLLHRIGVHADSFGDSAEPLAL